MSPNHHTANLVLCASSPKWISAISSSFSQLPPFAETNFCWAASPNLIREFTTSLANGSIIVELTTNNLVDACEQLSEFQNSHQHWRWFGVGERFHGDELQLTRDSGCIATYGSVLQLESLKAAVTRHQISIPRPLQTIEERIWSSLPWATASNELDA